MWETPLRKHLGNQSGYNHPLSLLNVYPKCYSWWIGCFLALVVWCPTSLCNISSRLPSSLSTPQCLLISLIQVLPGRSFKWISRFGRWYWSSSNFWSPPYFCNTSLHTESPPSPPQCRLMSPVQVLPRGSASLNLNPCCHKYKTRQVTNTRQQPRKYKTEQKYLEAVLRIRVSRSS